METQHRTGAAILTHTEGPTGAMAQLDVFADAGADLSRRLIGHCDNSTEAGYYRAIAERGANVGFDRIGHFRTWSPPAPTIMTRRCSNPPWPGSAT